MSRPAQNPSAPAASSGAREPMPFSSADFRLTNRQWGAVLLLAGVAALVAPGLWKRLERFDVGPDYRLPYALSRDYWLYSRRLESSLKPANIVVLGDSVVWGEYVLPDGAWSHWLNREAGAEGRFLNCGVNGMFPLAMEGLVRGYGVVPRGGKVLLQCNLLWLTSPQADLSSPKEQHFNHSRLVPQFSPVIPAYRGDANERLGAWIQGRVPLLGWVNHLQDAYFDQKSIPAWTLADDGGDPPHYPNAWRNPFGQIRLTVPAAPTPDPQRGPESPRHKPWSDGASAGTTRFEWVDLDASLQWGAFRRVVETLQQRGNDLFVVVGPFNEHMLAEANRPAYRKIRDGIAEWLEGRRVPRLVPEALPSELYADASHPLTRGYELLARVTFADPGFRAWLQGP